MALGACIVPFIINYALLNLTADLLFLTLVLYFLTFAIGTDWIHRRKAAAILGFRGALLYLTKAVGFPLFLVLLCFSVLFSAFSDNMKQAAKAAMTSLVVFLLISSCWIIPLSMKYGRITLSEAASFNSTKEVAPLPGQTMLLPVLNGPLLSPADPYALSAWESPGDAVRLTPMHLFSSAKDFSHYLKVVKRNMLSIWYFDFRNQVGILFLLILLFYLVASRWKTQKRNTAALYLLCVTLILYTGYSLILVHTRYIWICTWFMLLISAWMLKDMAKHVVWKNRLSKVIFLVLFVLAVKRPVKEILFTTDADFPLLWIGKGITHPFETMEISYRPEMFLENAVTKLRKIPMMKEKIASLQTRDGVRHAYSTSLFITYKLASQYYGPLDSTLSPEQMKEQLLKSGISIMLVFNQDVWVAKDEEWVREVYTDSDLGLTVFRLF